jgi:hypothetical protein
MAATIASGSIAPSTGSTTRISTPRRLRLTHGSTLLGCSRPAHSTTLSPLCHGIDEAIALMPSDTFLTIATVVRRGGADQPGELRPRAVDVPVRTLALSRQYMTCSRNSSTAPARAPAEHGAVADAEIGAAPDGGKFLGADQPPAMGIRLIHAGASRPTDERVKDTGIPDCGRKGR